MDQTSRRYVDENQYVHHRRDEELGRGGQGVVYRTMDADVAMKFVTDDQGNFLTEAAAIKKHQLIFKQVCLLPLPEGIDIATPAAVLKDHAGYVMRLLSEMKPFSSFLYADLETEETPAWLAESPEDTLEKILGYRQTGGLRRRLTALHKSASILARLHGAGLVYGDISPANIYVSDLFIPGKPEETSVWLIDADNIRLESGPEITSEDIRLWTDPYGAPELVQGKGKCRQASDCYSFAVLAFHLLADVHPFEGAKIFERGGDTDGLRPLDKAYAGYYPWIDDPLDQSNALDSALNRDLVLTEELRLLFEVTFGDGRLSPERRPTIYHWPEALARSADLTIRCPACHMYYYDDLASPGPGRAACPYCRGPKPRILRLKAYPWPGPDLPPGAPVWCWAREIDGHPALTVPERVFEAFSMTGADNEQVRFVISEKNILIEKDRGKKMFVSLDDPNSFEPLGSKLQLDRAAPNLHFWLLADSGSGPPRLVSCSITGEPR